MFTKIYSKTEDIMMKYYLRKRCQILAMLLGVSLFILTACGSTTAKEAENVVVEEAVIEVANSEAEETVSNHKVVLETIVEETVVKETEKELYIPEGVVMESKLSGEEWIASFVGNVNEPVVVIFNDNNGRKEVVQEDSEVIINPDEDRIALYWTEIGTAKMIAGISIKESINADLYDIIVMDAEKMRNIPERPIEITMEKDSEKWYINFTIISE